MEGRVNTHSKYLIFAVFAVGFVVFLVALYLVAIPLPVHRIDIERTGGLAGDEERLTYVRAGDAAVSMHSDTHVTVPPETITYIDDLLKHHPPIWVLQHLDTPRTYIPDAFVYNVRVCSVGCYEFEYQELQDASPTTIVQVVRILTNQEVIP